MRKSETGMGKADTGIRKSECGSRNADSRIRDVDFGIRNRAFSMGNSEGGSPNFYLVTCNNASQYSEFRLPTSEFLIDSLPHALCQVP
jgi:hypothetical protein